MADITPESSLQEINQKFQDLITAINGVQTTITNLDLLRIQSVYHPQQTQDINLLSDFITTCWAKLATYHAVYFDLGSAGTLSWKDMTGQTYTIKTGDYLVKMPDNQSIYIPGNKNQYYYPSGYDTTTGKLTFTMSSSTPVEHSVVVPDWIQGSSVGCVTHSSWSTKTNSASITFENAVGSTNAIAAYFSTYINNGCFYVDNEQIVFNTSLTITNTTLLSNQRAKIDVQFPDGAAINGYYIPYITMPS